MHYFENLPRYCLARLYCALSVLANVLNAVTEPRSLATQVLNATDPWGWFWLWGLSLTAGIALADVLVNDLLPKQYHMPTTWKYRHIGFIGMALLLCGLANATYMTLGWTPVLFTWWVDSFCAATIAFLDLLSRRREPC